MAARRQRPRLQKPDRLYCGVYAGSTTTFVPAGPIWLGYYRSEDGGRSFRSSLVPGYPGDASPRWRRYGPRPREIRNRLGRSWACVYGIGKLEAPAGTKKTFGDEWVARFDIRRGKWSDY